MFLEPLNSKLCIWALIFSTETYYVQQSILLWLSVHDNTHKLKKDKYF